MTASTLVLPTSSEWPSGVALATKRRFGPRQMIEHITGLEAEARARRSLERRSARSRIGRFKPMADFDWAWPKHIDRDTVDAVLQLEFLADARNVVLVAPQGLGKTMIAQNIVHAAPVFSRDRKYLSNAQAMEFVGERLLFFAVDLVDRKKQRLAAPQ